MTGNSPYHHHHHHRGPKSGRTLASPHLGFFCGVAPAEAGIRLSLQERLTVAGRARWIPARAALGRNDGSGQRSIKLDAFRRLICADPPSFNLSLKITFASHRRSSHASQKCNLSDVREGVRNGSLKDLLGRIAQRPA